MEMAEEEDIKFILDENLDFGLSSPSDSREEEEEEEVSISPAQPIERSVARRIDLNVQKRESADRNGECLARWSPLSAEKLEEIVKEANRLAVQLERCSLREKENASARLPGDVGPSPAGEALTPLRLLHKERSSPRSPRRETFVVKNSPVRALLPTVESGTLFPLGKGPSPRTRATPTPPRLRHKLGSCSAGTERIHKKSTPSKAPVLSPTKRSQSSKKLSLQEPPRSPASPTVVVKKPTGPRSSPARLCPAQEPSLPRRRAEPLQKTSAGNRVSQEMAEHEAGADAPIPVVGPILLPLQGTSGHSRVGSVGLYPPCATELGLGLYSTQWGGQRGPKTIYPHLCRGAGVVGQIE
uniref:Proline and serine rich coiled-coil 1 n=1 Tax=Pelusios castaneus TaxID=367368 RepID=A0A8C8SHF6_9SAUR